LKHESHGAGIRAYEIRRTTDEYDARNDERSLRNESETE
jgi:hypothetical protein